MISQEDLLTRIIELKDKIIASHERQEELSKKLVKALEDKIEELTRPRDLGYPLKVEDPINRSRISFQTCPASGSNQPCDFTYMWMGTTPQPCKRCNTTMNSYQPLTVTCGDGIDLSSNTVTFTGTKAPLPPIIAEELYENIKVDNAGTVNLGESKTQHWKDMTDHRDVKTTRT